VNLMGEIFYEAPVLFHSSASAYLRGKDIFLPIIERGYHTEESRDICYKENDGIGTETMSMLRIHI